VPVWTRERFRPVGRSEERKRRWKKVKIEFSLKIPLKTKYISLIKIIKNKIKVKKFKLNIFLLKLQFENHIKKNEAFCPSIKHKGQKK